MGRDSVKEPPVVSDNHRTAGKFEQSVLKTGQGFDVEVVGWLVKQQQVTALFQG